MTRLQDLLADVADVGAPAGRAARLAERAVDSAGRHRRRRLGAAGAAAVAALVVAVSVVAGSVGGRPDASPAGTEPEPVVPSVLHTVQWWQAPTVVDRPIERASLAVGGLSLADGWLRPSEPSLLVVDARSGEYRRVPAEGLATAMSAALSPDGRLLATLGEVADDTGRLSTRLQLLDLTTGQVAGDVDLRTPAADRIEWAPDGSRVVVNANARTAVVDVRTGALRTVGAAGYAVTWDADGQALIALTPAVDGRPAEWLDVQRVGPDGTVEVLATLKPEELTGGAGFSFTVLRTGPGAVSPDGDALVVMATTSTNLPAPWQVLTVSLDGSGTVVARDLAGGAQPEAVPVGRHDGRPVLSVLDTPSIHNPADRALLTTLDPATGSTATLVRAGFDATGGMTVVSAATDVLAEARVADVGTQPAPAWHPLSLASQPLLLVVLVGLAVWGVRRVRRRRPTAVAGAAGAGGPTRRDDTPSGQDR